MGLRHPASALAILAVAGLLAALSLAATAPSASAASACKRWGNTPPAQLTTSQARRSVLCLVNRKRVRHNASRLDPSGKLERAAQAHSEYMVARGCFAHECPGERPLGLRLEIVDYLINGLRSWLFGENIAWGTGSRGTPRSIVAAWMNSAGHRTVMLNGSFRDAGVGYAVGDPTGGNDKGGVYTLDVADRTR